MLSKSNSFDQNSMKLCHIVKTMMFSSSLIMVYVAPCFKELLPFVPIYKNLAIVGASVSHGHISSSYCFCCWYYCLAPHNSAANPIIHGIFSTRICRNLRYLLLLLFLLMILLSIQSLASLNSAANPIIYGIFSIMICRNLS